MGKDQIPPGSPTSENGQSDSDLARLAGAGDEIAFEALIRRKRERVLTVTAVFL